MRDGGKTRLRSLHSSQADAGGAGALRQRWALTRGRRKPARRAPVYHFGSCALLQRDKGPDMRPLLPSEHMGKTLAMKAGSGFHGDTGAAIHSLPFGPAVTRQLHSWIYEELVTSALETGTKARRAEGWWVDVGSPDATDRLEFLVYQPLRRALEGIPEEDNTQSTNQVAPANRPSEVVLIADDRVANAAQRHGPRRSHRRDGPAGQGRSQIARCAALRPIEVKSTARSSDAVMRPVAVRSHEQVLQGIRHEG